MMPVAKPTVKQEVEDVIKLEGLGVRFGKVQALEDLNGSFNGRALGLLGPNGAGKTTLIHTLLGFHRPTSGRASLLGHPVAESSRAIRELVGYMPERDSFIAGMSAVRFVRMMGELSGLPASVSLERSHEALYNVGLGEARYRAMDEYSLGMKQRAKLAQALVHGPRLLFLDEPTNGLDPPARERMLQLIREVRDSGEVNLVLSSHLLRDVEECCEEVLILKGGRIVRYTNLEQERQANRKFLEMEVLGDTEGFVAGVRALGCDCAPYTKNRLKMVLPPEVKVRDLYGLAREKGLQIRYLDYKKDSLQDIFLQAMEGDV